MSKYSIIQDIDRCIGCLSCEVYCKENKRLADGPKLCQIMMLGPRTVRGLPAQAYVYMGCYHCEHPACVAACPTQAMKKRASDGIVYVEKDLCIGCKACMVACPWGAAQWDPDNQRVVKCDLCMDRVDQGLQPVCVTVCTTQCLRLKDLEDPEAKIS